MASLRNEAIIFFKKQTMLTVNIKRTYKFVKSGGCDDCDLLLLCNEIDTDECLEGEGGHYEEEDEEIEQL